jgi:hypothetical protein
LELQRLISAAPQCPSPAALLGDSILKTLKDQTSRLRPWIGNIGALHQESSPLSLESRLREADDVLIHILVLLDNLSEVAGELLQIASGERVAQATSCFQDDSNNLSGVSEKETDEVAELLEEIGACITRLFRVSTSIRLAAPSDTFMKAVSKNRYQFNDEFDIAHVGEKFPKLTSSDRLWLRKRLGRAITQRRHYLSYIQDPREELDGARREELSGAYVDNTYTAALHATQGGADSSSRPSTFVTKASTLVATRRCRLTASCSTVGFVREKSFSTKPSS